MTVINDTELLTNSNGCRIPYSEIRNAMDGPFPMILVGRDAEVCKKMVNMGIDSRLQACFIDGQDYYFVEGNRLKCSISKESLPVLIRRLFEDTEFRDEDGDDQDVGSSLGEAILDSLGFDEFGVYNPNLEE